MCLFKPKVKTSLSALPLLANAPVRYDGENNASLPLSQSSYLCCAEIFSGGEQQNKSDSCAMSISIFIPALLLSCIILAREFCWFDLPCVERQDPASACNNMSNHTITTPNRTCLVPMRVLPCAEECSVNLPPLSPFFIAFAVFWQLVGCVLVGRTSVVCNKHKFINDAETFMPVTP